LKPSDSQTKLWQAECKYTLASRLKIANFPLKQTQKEKKSASLWQAFSRLNNTRNILAKP